MPNWWITVSGPIIMVGHQVDSAGREVTMMRKITAPPSHGSAALTTASVEIFATAEVAFEPLSQDDPTSRRSLASEVAEFSS